MKQILVSVISEQTIPNLLLIKEFEEKYDDMLFISTKQMEEKGQSRWIERAAGIDENSTQRLVVDPDSINKVTEKLEHEVDLDNKYLVNLTGGTKPMSIAIYQYFAKENNRIVYVPIGKNNYECFYPSEPDFVDLNIVYKLSLAEYLTAYGLFFESTQNLSFPEQFTSNLFNRVKNKQFVLQSVREIQNANTQRTSKEKDYYSGKWFEEWSYSKLMKEFDLMPENIAMNIKISRKPNELTNDNEFDIMFVHDNNLYVVECKTNLGGGNILKENLDKALYKLGAITRDFGLRVMPYIFTLTNMVFVGVKTRETYHKRLKILGIHNILDCNDLINNKILNK